MKFNTQKKSLNKKLNLFIELFGKCLHFSHVRHKPQAGVCHQAYTISKFGLISLATCHLSPGSATFNIPIVMIFYYLISGVSLRCVYRSIQIQPKLTTFVCCVFSSSCYQSIFRRYFIALNTKMTAIASV